jgi:excisionase family DNA binding protein
MLSFTVQIKLLALTNSYKDAINNCMNLLTTKEVSKRLGVTVTRVQAMISSGRLPAAKIGRDYIIQEADLKLVADRKPGRPPQADKKKSASERKRAKI